MKNLFKKHIKRDRNVLLKLFLDLSKIKKNQQLV